MSADAFPDVLAAPGGTGRIHGVVTAKVLSLQDDRGLGRVKLSYTSLPPGNESPWARVAVPLAAKESGTYLLPGVGDEVLVAFEDGDQRLPYVLGSLWSANVKPPEADPDGKNPRRTIKTPAGHVVRLDDTPDAERIELLHADRKTSIVLSAGKLEIRTSGDVTIASTEGKLVLEAKEVEISATSKAAVSSGGPLELKASAVASLDGQTVKLG